MSNVVAFKPALEARDRDRLAKTAKASDLPFYVFGDTNWVSSIPFTAHEYRTADNQHAFEVRRQGRGEAKAFKIKHLNPLSFGDRGRDDEDWLDGYGDQGPLPYKLPELLVADKAAKVWLCEGEPDVEALMALGEIATTNPGGAKAWRVEFAQYFAGRHIIICEDNDAAGRARTKWIRKALRNIAASISVVRFVDMPEKSDVRDFLEDGNDLEALKARVEKLEIIIGTESAETVDEIEEQLAQNDDVEIFQYLDGLYRVIADYKGERLHRLTTADMLDHISRHCTFVRWKEAGRGENKTSILVPAKPTKDLAEALLARVGRWHFRTVKGVRSAPIVRPNGDVVTTSGYDPVSGFYLVLPPGEITVGDTKEKAQAALKMLQDDLFFEVAFQDNSGTSVDRAVYMSSLLTVIARPSIDVAPMHAVRGPVYGAGKSLSADVSSVLATGRKAKALTWPKTEEEGEKRLAAVAMVGGDAGMICLDNANDTVSGDLLAVLIERPRVSVRVLQQSKVVDIDNCFTILTNGVNTVYKSDLVRRTVLANIDPKLERPENHEFNGDPCGAVAANREKYLGAVLTIMSAYLKHLEAGGERVTTYAIKDGSRVKLERFNSFGQWSKFVREPLVWLGMGDPVASLDTIRAEDTELMSIRSLFAAWPEIGSKYSVGALMAHADAHEQYGQATGENALPDLKSILFEFGGDGPAKISDRKLGHAFRKLKGRIVSGKVLQCEFNNGIGANVWWLSEAKPTSKN